MPRQRRSLRRAQEHVPLDIERLTLGAKRLEQRRGAEYHVQPLSARNAVKTYTCPGCSGQIGEGVQHVVVWRADSIFGDRAVEDRRHWHDQCWRTA